MESLAGRPISWSDRFSFVRRIDWAREACSPLLLLKSGLNQLIHRASKRNGYSVNIPSYQGHRAIAMTVSSHYSLSPTYQPEHLWPSDSPLLADLDAEEIDL